MYSIPIGPDLTSKTKSSTVVVKESSTATDKLKVELEPIPMTEKGEWIIASF